MRDTMTMTATTDQWMQFYQQPLMEESHGHGHDHDHDLAPNTESFSDSTVMTTSPTPTMSQLTPKGNVSKPIRRRSRVSKKTPTTLLNANTTNFRALVQQFTGCPSTTMPTLGLGIHKGPITLNFQQGSGGHKIHNNTSRVVPPFSDRSYNNNNTNQVHQVPAPLPVPQQQVLQEQQSGYSFSLVKNTDFLPSSGNSIRPGTSMDVSDALLLDNDFSLPDLTSSLD
ncbi:hypothetical protein CR513_07691, partial [Mucuna pruriens]